MTAGDAAGVVLLTIVGGIFLLGFITGMVLAVLL